MIVFDDRKTNCFYPLTLNRCIGDLRCGILKLRQRLQALFPDEDNSVWVDPKLQPLYQERHPEWLINKASGQANLLINSRLKVNAESIAAIKQLKTKECLCNGEDIIAFRSGRDEASLSRPDEMRSAGYILKQSEIDLYSNLADIIHDNGRMLRFDFDHFFYDKDNFFETEPGVTTLHPYNIWISENVEIKPGVVLDASEGPIVLDEGVRIMPNAVIIGPAYIGKKTLVKIGAKIYGNTSIGPVCKVGGEIEGSIFQAFSNKQHDGFLGHSYVGEWVNIGADTNNSDLKNTYRNVSYYSYATQSKVDSGTMFLGVLIGDHVKLGINTSINTGSVIGFGSNLWGSDLISDLIPEFSWGKASELVRYRFDAFCQTAELVKQRRSLVFSDTEKALCQNIFNTLEI